MGHSHKVFSYTNAVLGPKACKNRPNYSGIFSTPCRFFTDLLCCTLSSSIVTDSVGPIETGFSVYRSQLDLCSWSCVVLLLYVWSLCFEPKHSCWARTVESDLVAVTGAAFRTTAGRLIGGTRHSWRINIVTAVSCVIFGNLKFNSLLSFDADMFTQANRKISSLPIWMPIYPDTDKSQKSNRANGTCTRKYVRLI